MKKMSIVLLVAIAAVFIAVAGCTVTSEAPGGRSVTSTPIQQTTAAPTTITEVPKTTAAGAVLFEESFNMKSGFQTVYKKYALEDYGYLYLYPGDRFSLSLTSNKPVNVLVIGKTDEIKFDSVEPVWDTALKQDQWDYSPLVPAFSQSNVEKKEMTFTIKDRSTYYLIVDPRFASDLAGWKGSRHDDVIGTVRLTKI